MLPALGPLHWPGWSKPAPGRKSDMSRIFIVALANERAYPVASCLGSERVV